MNIHILTAEIEQLRAKVARLEAKLEAEQAINNNLKNRLANPKKHR